MARINNNIYNQSFSGKLHLTSYATESLNAKIRRILLPVKRQRVLAEYDKFIKDVADSAYNVYVSTLPENMLLAEVSKIGTKKTIAYAINRNKLLAKLGLENPIKFMQQAFEKAQRYTK